MITRLLLLAACLIAVTARAEPIRADVIVFAHPEGSAHSVANQPGVPDNPRAVPLDDAKGLKQAGITMISEAKFGLAREWSALSKRAGYEPLLKLAFQHEWPTSSNGVGLKLFQPQGDGTGLNGWLRLLPGKAGGVEAEIEYLINKPDGSTEVHRLRQKRSFGREGALHYFDGGRIGLLVRLTRPAPLPAPSSAAAARP
jgi:hypothetical protein